MTTQLKRAPVASWESVLAAVEADVQQSETMLSAASWPVRAPVGRLAPAEVMLPTGPHPHLPDLADMPDVPAALVDTVQRLRARITALQRELTLAMADVAAHMHALPAPRASSATAAPRYLDRSA